MKVRMTAVAAALVLAVSAMPALAQQPGPPRGGPGGGGARRLAALLNGITLTAQQQARIDSIQAAFRAQMPAFTPGQPPDSAAMQQRRVMLARQDSTMRAVLTPEQQAIWDRNVQSMPQFPGRRPPGQ